jgi:hypothetical protein
MTLLPLQPAVIEMEQQRLDPMIGSSNFASFDHSGFSRQLSSRASLVATRQDRIV